MLFRLLIIAFFLTIASCDVGRPHSNAFDAVHKGDSVDTVIEKLGKPDEIRACSENLYWGGDHAPIGPNDGSCVEEYYFTAMPGGYSVGFNDAGEVVAKYEYVSP